MDLVTLEKEYSKWFTDFGINKKTGILNSNSDLKFITFPYVGSKYGQSKKILFVGLDVGSDEKIGGIQSIVERQKAIENKCLSKHNPHIAGTYFSALFFLKENLKLTKFWNNLKNSTSCQKALSNGYILPTINPLSYVALTNYYKFVRSKRIHKSGSENRKYLNKALEKEIFVKELNILNPEIIIFQSKSFKKNKSLIKDIINKQRKIYVGPHPAYRDKREPEYFVSQIKHI